MPLDQLKVSCVKERITLPEGESFQQPSSTVETRQAIQGEAFQEITRTR